MFDIMEGGLGGSIEPIILINIPNEQEAPAELFFGTLSFSINRLLLRSIHSNRLHQLFYLYLKIVVMIL